MQSTNDSPHIKLLYLLIQNKTNVHYLLSVVTEPDSLFTESSHKAIFKACAWARDKDKTISTEQFEYFCKFNLSLTPQKTSVLVAEYAAIESIENVKAEDISVLIEECKNLYYYRFFKERA